MRHHPRVWARRWVTAVCSLALAGGAATVVGAAPTAAVSPGDSSVYSAAATFEGPVTVGHIIEPETALPTGVAQHDYVEQEYFAVRDGACLHPHLVTVER